MAKRIKLLRYLDFHHADHKLVMLYRFHTVLIAINLIAVVIDIFFQRYVYVAIELSMAAALAASLIYLRRTENIKVTAHLFMLITAIGLFVLIYVNHFATMSIVFILLLPLTTLLFLDLKESLVSTALLMGVMALLLYIEYRTNPANPLTQNANVLFNLAYTAVIIYVFGLLYHVAILRTFKELDDANRQKALLLQEVHHRVKNNLNVIASIIGLQQNRLEGKERQELIKSKTRIESIALVHEMLYRHEDFENIDFVDYMKRLSNLLLGMYAGERKIDIDIETDVKSLPLDVMVQLGIMVNELLTNSIKYAFGEEGGGVSLSLHKEGREYMFVYSDDGVGHPDPESLKKSDSLGVKLIYLTARQLKGTLEVSAPKGLQYTLRFEA